MSFQIFLTIPRGDNMKSNCTAQTSFRIKSASSTSFFRSLGQSCTPKCPSGQSI